MSLRTLFQNKVRAASVSEMVVAPRQGGDLRAALDGPQGAQYLWHERGDGIAADIARGLAYIHTTGIVHRCI